MEELHSALFRVNLLTQISYFFSNERLPLRAHLESIIVMKSELKNQDNPYLKSLRSLEEKIADYFKERPDFALDDKLGILAHLV